VAAATGVVRKRSEATKERLAWLRRTEARRTRGVVATRCRHALLASEAMAQEVLEAALREPHDFPKLCETLSLCRESAESSGDLGWVGKHDAFLEPLLPSSAREVALQSQPGDVLKLKTGRGWHVLRVEDVMLDLRVQRREKGEMVQRGFNDKTYAVETMGCQMNQADSERMEGQLQAAGLVPAAAKEDPDVIVLNTCSIRDKAEKRVYARLDPHLQRKRRGEDVTIVVSGCVAQQEGEALLSAIPEVDVVVGPQYANRLADVLNESLQGGQICATADARIMEDVTMPNRQSSISAWVNVIYGCNERCSYCVVPATRGSEQSRPMEAVKREVAQLTSEGYREVTLLGQNIDAWGRDLAPRRNFSELLRYVGDVAGLQRLRFLTSHPRYISDELIHAVRDVDAVCEQFHIPFQSGDDDVLRRMERGYTAERYRQIVRKIRQEVPNAGLSADAIVGFPGETEEQFQRTVELVEEVGFLTVNLAAYSPRPNTLAATWPDQVPEDVKKDRLTPWRCCAPHIAGSESALAGRGPRTAGGNPAPQAFRRGSWTTAQRPSLCCPWTRRGTPGLSGARPDHGSLWLLGGGRDRGRAALSLRRAKWS